MYRYKRAMQTDKELAESVVADPTIPEKYKKEERKKLEICAECPEKNECWSCGFRRWWIDDVESRKAQKQSHRQRVEAVEGVEGVIKIEFGAVPNTNEARGGFLPMIWINDRPQGDTFGRGLDKDEAIAQAEIEANEEADHYVGDWGVSIQKSNRSARICRNKIGGYKRATITEQDIQELMNEAHDAGDYEMVRMCEDALDGDDEAWEECERVIESALAGW